MSTLISLQSVATGRMIGMRAKAVPVRKQILTALESDGDVVIDFSGLEVTQSFIDELIGGLLLRHGPALLDRMVFNGCSNNVRSLIKFVAADRCDQFAKVH